MKPGGIVNLNKINSFLFFRKNKLFLFICFSFVLGLIIGCISLFGNSKASLYYDDLFASYIKDRTGLSFFSVFLSSLLKQFITCFSFLVFGASIIGVVFSPLMSCFLGIYYGALAAYAYYQYSLKGIAFNAIILIPSAICFAICIFFAAKECCGFSYLFIKLLMPKCRPISLYNEFKLYCGKFILIFSVLLLSSLIDAAVSVSFLRQFTF